jgi:hypothetical protein
MFKSPTSKRVRAIVIALAITFASNYAISFAARPDISGDAGATAVGISSSSSRSGGGTKDRTPGIPPPTSRSGGGTKDRTPGIPPPQSPTN